MRALLLIALLAGAANARPSWLDPEGENRSTVVISSGPHNAIVDGDGNLHVEVISQPNDPVIIQDESASDAELERLFVSQTGIQTAGGSIEQDVRLWSNPSTSTINMHIDRLYMNVFDTKITFKFYIDSIITSSGTVDGAQSSFVGSSAVAQVNVFLNPTISVRGTLAYVYQVTDQTIPDDVKGRVILAPGHTLLMTISPQGTNKDWSTSLFWAEKEPKT